MIDKIKRIDKIKNDRQDKKGSIVGRFLNVFDSFWQLVVLPNTVFQGLYFFLSNIFLSDIAKKSCVNNRKKPGFPAEPR
jgi:hypothetical protein